MTHVQTKASIIGLLILVSFEFGCDTDLMETEVPSVSIVFDQRDPKTRDVIQELGTFELDLMKAFSLNKGAHKNLSIEPTPFVRFRTWRRIDDGIRHEVFIIVKHPSFWYYGLMVQPAATLIYGDNNPTPFEGELYAFFIEDILPVPQNEIPLFIEADGFLDSLMVEPERNLIPRSYFKHITRSMFPAMSDTLMLFITAASDQLLDRQFIPVLAHTPRKGGRWDGIWTMELFEKTTDLIGTLPTTGIAKDYEVFMMTFKK